MESSGSDKPDILVIGEAPGADEDTGGIPFIGESGQLLRSVLDTVFVDKKIRFTNVVRCRPPNNMLDKKCIDYCAQFALDDISNYNPEVVLLMGNSPLKGILGQQGISKWNGVTIKKDDRTYVPLFHPAYILRDNSHLDEWLEAMANVGEEPENVSLWKKVYPKTIPQMRKMAEWLKKADTISFDIETNSLNAFNEESKVLSVSFAYEGVAYAFPLHHHESWWTTNEKTVCWQIIADILKTKSCNIVGHNIKFDQMFMKRFGVEFEAGSDSMLISHLLHSIKGIHGLKKLASIHLGMYNYDDELTAYKRMHKEADPDRGGNYDAIPLEILLPYGALDAEATLKLDNLLYEKLSDKQKILLNELIMPASDTLCTMQCNGFTIDDYIAQRYVKVYGVFHNEAYDEIVKDPKVRKFIKYRKGISKTGKFRFNPNSSLQLQELYFDYYDIPVLARSKKTHAPSTSSKLYKPLESTYPILGKIRLYKLLGKMLSTYIIPAATGKWQGNVDGKARTTYNLDGTVTGRTSSSKPMNFQNIPTPEKEPGTILAYLPVKNIFTHSYQVQKNGLILHKGRVVSADYSGMELRCFASLSHCSNMIRIIEIGKDVHSCVAIMSMTHKMPDDIEDEEIQRLPKPVRYVYKWTNWTLLYGGSAYTLHRLYNVPLDEAEETVRMYYEIFPEVLEYKDICVEFARSNGYIESPYGRRELLPYIDSSDNTRRAKAEREAVNMPVQSGAGDTLLAAMVMVQAEMNRMEMRTRLVNEVHDSLVADCPLEEIPVWGHLAKDVMSNVKTYGKKYMPNVDFSWITTPLKADIDIGTHYGTHDKEE